MSQLDKYRATITKSPGSELALLVCHKIQIAFNLLKWILLIFLLRAMYLFLQCCI